MFSDTTCQSDRTWVPSSECREVTCTVPILQNGYYMLDNSQVSAGSVLALPSVLTPLCSVGYTPVPPTTQTCQINGQWTGQTPTCIAITCGNLPQDFANGYYDVEGHSAPYEYNHAIVPSCNDGFYLQQGGKRHCIGINLWSGDDALCFPITCASPRAFRHGTYNLSQNEYAYGSVLVPSCLNDYHLENKENHRVCVNKDSWSGVDPVCQISQDDLNNAPTCIEGYKITLF